MPRAWMTKRRETMERTEEQMAKLAVCTEYTIKQLEQDAGWVTVPTLAARVAHAYKMTAAEYNTLVLDKYRVAEGGKLPPPRNPRKAYRCKF